jgi:hypothetical protein
LLLAMLAATSTRAQLGIPKSVPAPVNANAVGAAEGGLGLDSQLVERAATVACTP